MKIYISGPMTGIKNLNYPVFNETEDILTRMGYEVFNPAKIPGDDTWTWQDYMKECIREIPDCTHILLLRGWEKSEGANVEYSIAKTLGLTIMYEGQPIQWKNINSI